MITLAIKFTMKNIKTSYILISLAVIVIGGFGLSKFLQSNNPNIASTGAFHWHPELVIYVKGEKIEIPQGIGLAGGHKPMHTHDDLPLVHLEFGGSAKNEEIMLGTFFKYWGKEFNSFGTSVTMTVNGKENTELENYVMKDGDKIELRYE